LGICIAPRLEKIGFKRNTVSQLSFPTTPPWLLRHPEIDLSLHSSDKAVTPPDILKVRFYELCDRFKNFYYIYTDGSKMGHRVSAALCHKRGTSASRLPGATSNFNAELHAILVALDVVRRFKERHFLLLSDSYSSLIALGGSRVDNIQFINTLKHTALSQTLVKQPYSAGSPVTWGSLETREVIG